MDDLWTWLLVAGAVAAVLMARGGFRPPALAPTVVRAARTRSQPGRSHPSPSG